MPATANITVTDKQISGMLTNAFEGGSNYWYHIEDYRFAPGIKYADFCDSRVQGIGAIGRFCDPDCYFHPCQLIPLQAGCAVIISDRSGEAEEEKTYELNREAINRGIQIMATKYLRHFADLMNENDDADTGDVFLQCCIFGDVIYG